MGSIFKSMIKVIFFCGCFWMGGFLTFVQDIQHTAPASPQETNGIVILTGTPARLKTGFDLLKKTPGA
ncbi:MAG: hypothetical protein V7701_12325, partial [Sneathiella sp.]